MLKPEYIQKIRKDKRLRTKIVMICEVTDSTLYRWLNMNAHRLSTSDVLSVMSDHLGVSPDVMVEPPKEIFVMQKQTVTN